MSITVLGIDLAKTCFELYGIDAQGRKIISKTVPRSRLVEEVIKRAPELVAMEACGGSHHWGRRFRQAGLKIKMISPQHVKPFRLGPQKDDVADAKAIVRAATQHDMPTVAIKELWQQDIQFMHRIREDLVSRRTALSNQCRGILLELDLPASKTIKELMALVISLENQPSEAVPPFVQRWLPRFREQLNDLEAQIEMVTAEIERVAVNNDTCKRLTAVPGIGPITATALVAYSGDGSSYKNGRQFAASLGVVPRRIGSGGKTQNLGITKYGDRYIRVLLIHGGRALVNVARKKPEKGQSMASRLLKANKPSLKVAVAMANRNARIAWRVIAKGESYDPRRA